MTLETIDDLQAAFGKHGYIADRDLATAVFLSLALGRPLLLEGEAGVGKTEVARTLALSLGAELIRLQYYEGIDVSTAVFAGFECNCAEKRRRPFGRLLN